MMKNKNNELKNKIIRKIPNKKYFGNYSKNEILFSFIVILIVVCLGAFWGYKSLFSDKHTSKTKEEINTFADVVLANNRVTKRSKGLYKDGDGYIFRGNVNDNYVKFAGRLFRIVKVNSDNTVKVASLDSQAVLAYGNDNNYKHSNIYNWLNKTNKKHSGIYQDTIPGIDEFLVKTSWCKGELINDSVECSEEKGEDYFTLLTLDDYVAALGKDSYLNTKKNNWLLGRNADGSNLYVTEDGSVVATENYESFGTIVVFTFQKNIKLTGGNGTLDDPYIIDQKDKLNNINKFVRLDNDIWRIYGEDEKSLNLVLNNYIKDSDGDSLLISYSEDNDSFNPSNVNNIAYYLNNDYYNSLSYKDILGECTFYNGEISFSNLDYENIYFSHINNKVGLLNSYDLNLNTKLTDYFLMDTTSSVGSMAYIYKKDNTLEEVRVSDSKKVVPTVCLPKYLIFGGTGSIEDPFVIE